MKSLRSCRILSILALIAMLFSSLSALSYPTDEIHSSAKDRLIVSYEGEATVLRLLSLAEDCGSEIRFIEDLNLAYWTSWGSAIKGRIEKVAGVSFVSQEISTRVSLTPDDTLFGSTYQWGIQRIKAPQAWDYTLGNKNITIAVLDTGIDYTHDDIYPNMWRDSSNHYGYDFWNDDTDPMDDNKDGYEGSTWTPDLNIYHGTHVAGVAGAVTNNALGIAGVAQVKLMAVKVMNESGEGTDATVAEGITYAVDQGANIITMSLGVASPTLALGKAVTYAAQKGVIMMAAAGNDGVSTIAYPAGYSQVIAVGASDKLDHKASFSNYGSALEIMAPGTQIWSTKPGDVYQELAGTSTATPFVAGVVGLMLSVNPALTPGEIRDTLNETATDLGSAGWDSTTGWGLVNAQAAVTAVAGPATTIISYPESVEPNATMTIKWVVSGAGNLPIQQTYLTWGYSSSSLNLQSEISYGNTTPHTYTIGNIVAPNNGSATMYFQAVAIVNGTQYISSVVEIPIESAVVNPIIQFFESLRNFIVEDLGIFNFLIILVAIIALIIVLAVARSRKRRSSVAYESQAGLSDTSATMASTPVPAHEYAPSAPQPAVGETADVGISAIGLSPSMIEILQGTKVVWRNRDWAPPPGISVVSGYIDAMGPHPNGIFASGMMIAPGEFWSCVFNVPGTYNYYIANLNINGQIVVKPRA